MPDRSSNPNGDWSLVPIVTLALMASIATVLPGQVKSDDPVIGKARQAASAFTESLPKYLVKRITTRYQSDAAACKPSSLKNGHGCQSAESWRTIDIISADVTTENGKEAYTNIRLNGNPAADLDKSGAWTEGEFSSTLWAILSPESDASFTGQRGVALEGRSAYRYDFSIDAAHSSWRLYVTATAYAPAYAGTIWIDKETSRVLRVEMSARNLPGSFPMTTVQSTVEYAFVKIAQEDYLFAFAFRSHLLPAGGGHLQQKCDRFPGLPEVQRRRDYQF